MLQIKRKFPLKILNYWKNFWVRIDVLTEEELKKITAYSSSRACLKINLCCRMTKKIVVFFSPVHNFSVSNLIKTLKGVFELNFLMPWNSILVNKQRAWFVKMATTFVNNEIHIFYLETSLPQCQGQLSFIPTQSLFFTLKFSASFSFSWSSHDVSIVKIRTWKKLSTYSLTWPKDDWHLQ